MRRCLLALMVVTPFGCSTEERSAAQPSPTTSAGGASGETGASGSDSSPGGSSAGDSGPGTSGDGDSGASQDSGDTSTTGDDPSDGSSTSGDTTTAGSTGGDDTGDPVSPCCSPSEAGGCGDAPIETCVCAQDDYCCSGQWDIACVTEVEDFNCGSCGMADEIATCEAFCATLVDCDPELGFTDVQTCVQSECLGLLDQAQAESEACLDAMSQYYACIGLLACPGYDDYVGMNPPNGFPCMGFQNTMFETCSFIAG